MEYLSVGLGVVGTLGLQLLGGRQDTEQGQGHDEAPQQDGDSLQDLAGQQLAVVVVTGAVGRECEEKWSASVSIDTNNTSN